MSPVAPSKRYWILKTESSEMISSIPKAIKALYGLKNQVEVWEAVLPILEQLNEAQLQSIEMAAKISKLSEENTQLKTQLKKDFGYTYIRSKYETHKFTTGGVVFKLKDGEVGDYEYLCPTCLEKEKISGLQKQGIVIKCMEKTCGFNVRYRDRESLPQIGSARTSFDGFL